MKTIELPDIAWAAALVVINGCISIALRLKLEKSLLLASVRTIVQLLLVGYVLQKIFENDHWYAVLAMVVFMTIVAGTSAVGRTSRRYPGIYIDSLLAIWCSSWIVSIYGLLIVFRSEGAWYQPQYAIPLTGMILGNSLNGISLGLNQLGEQLATRRGEVESMLALGATRWEAAQPCVSRAVQTGMTPVINSMMVVGLVNLPGMMTGQLLAGATPSQAVRYQIIIMFMIAAATAMGTVGVVLLSFRRHFNADHQMGRSQPPVGT